MGIKAAGVDARLGDIGRVIREVMESHECFYNGKREQVKTIANLSGHLIEPYNIHAGISVACVDTKDSTRMKAGQCFAVKTLALGVETESESVFV